MRRLYVIAGLIFVFAGVVFAQPGPPEHRDKQFFREELRERIEMIRMWKLVETLDLTEEQSMKFFPLMNEYDSARDEYGMEQKRLIERLDEELKSQEPDEKELQAILDSLSEIREKQFAEETEYYNQVKGILTVEQQAGLLVFKRDFAEEVRRLIEMGKERGPGRPNIQNRP